MSRTRLAGLLFVFLVVLSGGAGGAELVGRVVGVLDGDTLEVLSEGQSLYRVRLAGIDAPEKKQAFGSAAKKLMSDLTYKATVVVTWHKRDRYGRIIGKVQRNGLDVGLVMVQKGMAWHYKQYQSEQPYEDRLAYDGAEREARFRGLGLWSEKGPVAPWAYRKARRSTSQPENPRTF